MTKEERRQIAKAYIKEEIKVDLECALSNADVKNMSEEDKNDICEEIAESVLEGTFMDDDDFYIAINCVMFEKHGIQEYIPW